MYVAYATPPLIPCLWPNHQMVTTFFPVKLDTALIGLVPETENWAQQCWMSLLTLIFCEPLSKSFPFLI